MGCVAQLFAVLKWGKEPFFILLFLLQNIKPANILLNETGHAFLTDFGMSMVMEGAHLITTDAAGTSNYMAPEMFSEGERLTPAIDVWGAGCVVLEMLTGQKPLDTLSFEVCRVKCLSLASFP